jgi:hypothetical protein
MTLKWQGTSKQMMLYLFPEMRRLMEIDKQGEVVAIRLRFSL